MAKIVYPVPGLYLNLPRDVPISTTAEIAKRLVRTGAYTPDKPAGSQPEPLDIEGYDLADLDFYDNPRGPDHDEVVHPTRTQGPAEAGPSDSAPEQAEE